MSEERFRNHPTTIVQHLFVIIVILIFSLNSIIMGDLQLGLIIIGVIVIGGLIGTIIYWSRRTMTFTETEAIVESNILYKKRKVIPYSKVGSVNLTRGVFNQIFGTTTLSIHVNTSANPKVAEARFTFDIDLAERIKAELSKGVFDQEDTHDEKEYESIIKFSKVDIILHSILGMPTYYFLFGFVMIIYSIGSAVFLEGSGMWFALLMYAVTQPIPMIMSFLKYLNFKMYRIGDHIHIQHGTIQKFVTKFDINRINAVRIRKPLIARMIGRSCLEAEVVGINMNSGDVTPLLCLMSKNSEIERTIRELVPEFIYETNLVDQPKSSRYPLMSKAVIGSLISTVILGPLAYVLYTETYDPSMSSMEVMFVKHVFLAALVLSILFLFYAAHVSFKIKKISKGDSLFTVINGLVDRQIVTMQYDRVQILTVSASPIARRFGLARGSIRLLAAMGTRNIKTGFFMKEDLDEIGDIMLERLKNGYDHKKNSI